MSQKKLILHQHYSHENDFYRLDDERWWSFLNGVPRLAIFLIFYNEPELGAEIDPGMALTPLQSSIGQGLNPQPSNHVRSALPLDHSFR